MKYQESQQKSGGKSKEESIRIRRRMYKTLKANHTPQRTSQEGSDRYRINLYSSTPQGGQPAELESTELVSRQGAAGNYGDKHFTDTHAPDII